LKSKTRFTKNFKYALKNKEKMAKKTTKTEKNLEDKKKTDIAEAKVLKEKRIGTHGKVFQGTVIKKFPKRVVIEFERMVYVKKYERYTKTKTKIHARLPESMENKINIGDLIKVQECRPLSKIIHFVVIEKVKDVSEFQGGQRVK
jgi:small subunit ribosomal protein S17